ncbi:MAG: DUF4097 family beta strand repeat-containing protein [Thermoanaerobaculia bacterium]
MNALRAGLLIALAAAAPAVAESGTVDREFHESFAVEPGDRLVLRHEDGDVRIVPWDRPELDVEVVYHAEYSEGGLGVSSERDFQVDFRRSGNEIRVTGRELGGGFRIGWNTLHVFEHVYTVRAPAWLALELRGDDGDVEIADWTGDTDIRLDDGDVTIERFDGTLAVALADGDLTLRDSALTESRLDLEDGDVELSGVEGGFRLLTEDGDVTAWALSPRGVYLQTADGDLDLEIGPTADVDLEVRTQDGHAELALATALSAGFEVTTDDGTVRLDTPAATDVREEHGQASGVLGSGAGRILVRTRDGRVTLRTAG